MPRVRSDSENTYPDRERARYGTVYLSIVVAPQRGQIFLPRVLNANTLTESTEHWGNRPWFLRAPFRRFGQGMNCVTSRRDREVASRARPCFCLRGPKKGSREQDGELDRG
jgi:hypothetical protein